ncbi:MAG: hypothetical protein GY868_11825, partial [Deltaproteobacteria bacterium]|nr:hypothetical protein [Deltaproteobacteria bacterium]
MQKKRHPFDRPFGYPSLSGLLRRVRNSLRSNSLPLVSATNRSGSARSKWDLKQQTKHL